MSTRTPLIPLRHAVARLRWPLPAVLAWAAGWSACLLAARLGWPSGAGFLAGAAASLLLAWPCAGLWRRALAAGGFPLSALALGAAGHWPAWVWLLLLLPLLAAYPLRAWRDAPFFPTPHDALLGLEVITGQPRRVLDAGCGLGHGLLALRRLWPQATLAGVEWSGVLSLLAAWRCRGVAARVRRGDMWAGSWAGYDLVYVFQRPESMQRVYDKARHELAPQAWLVSLEFAVPGVEPVARLQGPGRRSVWIYQPAAQAADAATAGSIQGPPCR